MTLPRFIAAVDNLVDQWRPLSDSEAGPDRAALEAIYNEVRNSTAFELATAQRERDEALRQLHKKITTR